MPYKIIIPDIHQQISKLKTILAVKEVQNAEEVIFLGDYFDSFNNQHQFRDTVSFLNDAACNPQYTFLMGNHDIHYLSNNTDYICSGYSITNHQYIRQNLSKEFRNKIKLYELQIIANENVLFCHAGIHPTHFTFSTDETNHASLVDYFDSLDININLHHPLLHAGRDRGGCQQHGGILWIDWSNLKLIEGLSQVVGHTEYVVPQLMDKTNSSTRNINIDTGLTHYLKIDLITNDWDVVDCIDLDYPNHRTVLI